MIVATDMRLLHSRPMLEMREAEPPLISPLGNPPPFIEEQAITNSARWHSKVSDGFLKEMSCVTELSSVK